MMRKPAQFPIHVISFMFLLIRRWDDIWLNEGLSTLFENIILNSVNMIIY